MGSPPCTRRREVPTRVWKALLKALLPTRGLPKVTHLMSAWGYCRAAHVAPAHTSMSHPSHTLSQTLISQHCNCIAKHCSKVGRWSTCWAQGRLMSEQARF